MQDKNVRNVTMTTTTGKYNRPFSHACDIAPLFHVQVSTDRYTDYTSNLYDNTRKKISI